MRVKSFFSIALSIILLTFSSCKKNPTANCGSNVVCGLLNGNTFSGDTYNSSGGPAAYQQGSYAILNKTNGQLTIIGGNGSTQSWVVFNIATSVQQGGTYNVSAGNVTCSYYSPNPSKLPTLPYYQWQDSSSLGTGSITITLLDSINNQVSGTFTNLTLSALYGQSPLGESFTSGYFTDLTLTY